MLGQKRASIVKEDLISQHGIESDRLVICVNKFDKEEKARPSVEIIFKGIPPRSICRCRSRADAMNRTTLTATCFAH